jgi:3-hydroxyisobutyrate dehydrogenase
MTREYKKPTVGWIGTGVMGRWMCHHILPLAAQTYVYNRTRSKTDELAAEGAIVVDSPAEIAQKADIIFTIVGHPSDVEEVYFSSQGILAHLRPNTICVDMTTTKPSLAIAIHKRSQEKGCMSLDAPVSGGDVGAREGKLTIMVGGDEQAYKQIEPFFSAMGKAWSLQGGPGAGQHTKMCNQIVIAGTMIGMCESLVYAHKAGLDGNTMVQTISGGAAACWSLDNLAPRVLKDNYDPGFMIDHFVKDMGIALEESRAMGLALPGLALVQQLYIALQGSGGGKLGTQALVLALNRLNDTPHNGRV